MGRIFYSFIFSVSLLALGCNQPSQAAAISVQDAIAQSNVLASEDTKVDYLVAQAGQFIANAQYDEAMALANHILSNVDYDSMAAQDILEKTNSQMQTVALTVNNDIQHKFDVN